jgi:hypothetical protein
MNIFTGLLFQQGVIANAELAKSLAGVAPTQPPCDTQIARSAVRSARRARGLERLRRRVLRSVTALSPFR